MPPVLSSRLIRDKLIHSGADLRSMPGVWPRSQRDSGDCLQLQSWGSSCLAHSTYSCSMSSHGQSAVRQTGRQGRRAGQTELAGELWGFCALKYTCAYIHINKDNPVKDVITSSSSIVVLARPVHRFTVHMYSYCYRRQSSAWLNAG